MSRSNHKNHLRPPVSSNRFLTKFRAFQCLQPLMWKGGLLQSIPSAFILQLDWSTVDTPGLSTSKHKLTQMISIACSTPSTISCAVIKSILFFVDLNFSISYKVRTYYVLHYCIWLVSDNPASFFVGGFLLFFPKGSVTGCDISLGYFC